MSRVTAKRLVAIGSGLALCVSAFCAVAQTPESGTPQAGVSATSEREAESKLVTAGQALLEAFDVLGTEIRDLEREVEASEGQEQRLLGRSLERKKVEILHLIRPILDNVLAQEREGFDARKIRGVIEPALERLNASLERHLDVADERMAASRA